MQKLTEKEHWDSIYRQEHGESSRSSLNEKLKIFVGRVFGKSIRNYSDYFLWEVILRKHLPKTKGLKVLEVGSAPGKNLVRLHQMFEFIPYGVEYSDAGVDLNRSTFSSNNINPDNVIKADFFSDDFQNQYKEQFDIVISMGFIEHFTEVEQVIEKHVNLLTKGGCLVVSIPNLTGFNGILAKIYNRRELAMHNTNIMHKKKFESLFNEEFLSPVLCDYYGTFNFGLFYAPLGSLLRIPMAFCKMFQLFLNMLFHLFLRDKGAESKSFSPHLIYIGIRK